MSYLSGKAKNLWAKKQNREGQRLWLPLVAHLIDTTNVINYLYNHWLNDGQRAILQDEFGEEETEKLIKFVGFFHDIGKATPAFQTEPSYNRDQEIDQELLEKLLRSGFSKLDDFYSSSRRESPHALAGEALLESNGLNDTVGAIIGGHHGKPASISPDDQISDYTSNYFQSDQNEKLQDQWKNSQKELFNYGLQLTGYKALNDVPIIRQPQAVILTGLLIMADWLASSEYLDNDYSKPLFPLIPLDKGFDDLNMEKRYENAINTWDNSDHWQAQPVLDINQEYQKRWHFNPRPVQQLISERIGKIVDPGIIIVECEMGSGKTEIAEVAVEQLASITGNDGLFMGLPTQATSNAMFSRVEQWVNSLSKEQQSKLPIKLMHGKAQFNEEMRSLPNAENISGQGAVVVNSWFSGKKSILTDFTIGTIDHLLLMGLKQKHLFLRHLGLSGKIVVIDEIHSYNIYMSSYLSRALEWLGAYHVPVIALSATLPKEKRIELIQAYAKGKYGHSHLEGVEKWGNNSSYPLLTYLDGEQVQQLDEFPPSPERKNKVVRLNCDNEELVDRVLDEISDGGIAGIVVNTVKRAQQLAQLIPNDVQKIVLHSAFLAPERSKLEDKLQGYIGKNGKRPSKMIVIGTQVLEQSLDIDFDVLFTDIAPIDLILQRMGRLHRHNINRPKKLATPTTYILGINSFGDYGDANEAIYEKYWLMKTDHFLPEKIVFPNDISTLVQQVYDSQTDKEVPNIDEPRLQEEMDVKIEKRKARTFQISRPRPNKTIHGWLDRDQVGADLNDATAEAAVRDIKESLEVILLQQVGNNSYLLNGQQIDSVDDYKVAQQLIRLPHAVTPDISKAIEKLEQLTDKYYHEWKDSPWLRGMLVLPLDKKSTTKFNGWQISYSSELGLIYKKDEDDAKKL